MPLAVPYDERTWLTTNLHTLPPRPRTATGFTSGHGFGTDRSSSHQYARPQVGAVPLGVPGVFVPHYEGPTTSPRCSERHWEARVMSYPGTCDPAGEFSRVRSHHELDPSGYRGHSRSSSRGTRQSGGGLRIRSRSSSRGTRPSGGGLRIRNSEEGGPLSPPTTRGYFEHSRRSSTADIQPVSYQSLELEPEYESDEERYFQVVDSTPPGYETDSESESSSEDDAESDDIGSDSLVDTASYSESEIEPPQTGNAAYSSAINHQAYRPRQSTQQHRSSANTSARRRPSPSEMGTPRFTQRPESTDALPPFPFRPPQSSTWPRTDCREAPAPTRSRFPSHRHNSWAV